MPGELDRVAACAHDPHLVLVAGKAARALVGRQLTRPQLRLRQIMALCLFRQIPPLAGDFQEAFFELGIMGLASLLFGLFRPRAIPFGSGHEPWS
jgi:hypothetical protein